MQQRMKEDHKWSAADTVTSLRIVAAIILTFLSWGTRRFLIVYTFAGLTDVLDGWLARKNQTASEFGARLDSIADLLFYGVLLIRMLPLLYQMIPEKIWYFVLGIIVVRLLFCYPMCFSLHSVSDIAGRYSLCKIRKARAAGSWCAAFQRTGATVALQRRQLREPETSLHQANSLNATDPHSDGRMHT